ncbi:MAG: metallophosphoesterase [Candidatus Brocadiia bacterium]
MSWLWIGVALAIVAGLLLGFWMIAIEPQRFRVWRVHCPCVVEPSSGEIAVSAGRVPPLTVLHVTDTHFSGRDDKKLDFLRRVASEHYDFAFLTGDILERPGGLSSCFILAEMLRPQIGSFAVLGAHDHFYCPEFLGKYTSLHRISLGENKRRKDNPVEELRAGLAARSVEVLVNENRIVRLPSGDRIGIVGLRDSFAFEIDWDGAWEDLGKDIPTLVLAHCPNALPEIADRKAEMAFFGHTHGGQVCFPLMGAIFTRSNIPRYQARGIFREDETVFTVNNGVGTGIGTSFRLLCPPEVTILQID